MKKININKIYLKGLLLIVAMLSYNCAWGQEWADAEGTDLDHSDFSEDGLYYKITSDDTDNKTVEVTYKSIVPHYKTSGDPSTFNYYINNSGYTGTIVIPSTVTHYDSDTDESTTYSVTGVGDHAFYACGQKTVTSITIPASVKYIGEAGFSMGQSNTVTLNSVVIESPSQLTTIADSAFYRTGGGELDLPEGLLTIGISAFEKTDYTHLTIPSTVESIGEAAFHSCSSLTWLKIGCKDIPENTFKSCSSLAILIITEKVETIQYDAFTSCKNLETVYSQSMTPATCVENSSNKISSFEECKSCWLVVPEDAAFNYDTKYTTNDEEGYYEGTKCDIEDWSDIGYQMREDTVTIEITTPEGYITHYSPYSYILQRGLTGGVVTDADANGKLTIDWCYNAGDVVPAGTAILLKGPQNSVGTTYANPTINTDDTTNPKPEINMMFGTVITAHEYDGISNNASYGDVNYKDDTSQNSSYYYYKLSYYTDEYGYKSLGFYWCEEDDLADKQSAGGQFSVDGGSTYDSGVKLAWLTIPTSTFTSAQQAKRVYYPLDENSTGIQTVKAVQPESQCSDVIYNIQGMRVKDMSKKGIYIVNGKKIMR